VESHLETLLEHLLKLAYMQGTMRACNDRLWQGTVKLARAKVKRRLAQNPSPRGKMDELFVTAYKDGRIRMLSRIKLSEDTIPATAPWSREQALDDSFIPNPVD